MEELRRKEEKEKDGKEEDSHFQKSNWLQWW